MNHRQDPHRAGGLRPIGGVLNGMTAKRCAPPRSEPPPSSPSTSTPSSASGAGDGECPECKGLGWVDPGAPLGHPMHGKFVPCLACGAVACLHIAALDRHSSHLRQAELQTFDNFSLEGPAAPACPAFNAAVEFAANPKGRWLVIHGPVGSGKSHLAAAVRNHLTRVLGVPTLFLTTPELLSSLREEVGASDERRGTPRALKTACDAPVLILDDLGAERLTPFAEEQLFLLLDSRYRRRWPTLVITNLPLEELPPRIGSRLADRELCTVVLNPAADYRWGDGRVSG